MPPVIAYPKRNPDLKPAGNTPPGGEDALHTLARLIARNNELKQMAATRARMRRIPLTPTGVAA